MTIHLKRAYDTISPNDGYRILVDRLWPRGIKKEKLAIDEWRKDIAPSTELRMWFHHDSEKFNEFKKRYHKELEENKTIPSLIRSLKHKTAITLVYSAKDTEHNQAIVLKEYLDTLL